MRRVLSPSKEAVWYGYTVVIHRHRQTCYTKSYPTARHCIVMYERFPFLRGPKKYSENGNWKLEWKLENNHRDNARRGNDFHF